MFGVLFHLLQGFRAIQVLAADDKPDFALCKYVHQKLQVGWRLLGMVRA
ncbi:hypothetical protein CLM71_12455 [Serratia sp. MYb239]|nr:hypothetical protein CLM71_12455 [Serratia sp. MYb239]